MIAAIRQRVSLIAVICLGILAQGGVVSAQDDGRPLIVIPGIIGSELVNRRTGEVVWPKVQRSKDDDLRLPITADPLKSRDDLIAGDIIRSIKIGIFPRIDVYQGLIDSFKSRAGYHEESWNDPTDKGAGKAIYVFPYDWRLDNVATARELVRRIEALKKKLKRPDLKFDVVAHSMGGLIVRYAAMYGDTELPSPIHRSAPWAGAKLFENIVLLGTPNEGSLDALYGFSGGSRWGPIPINLPWVQGISRFDVFTVPATYELLPAPGTLNVVDQYFDPIAIDLYEPETWSRYGWNPIDDPKFDREFTEEERKNAPAFFRAMLARTKHFYEALSAVGDSSQGVSFDLIGSECKETLDTLLIYRKGDRDQYRTLFKATSFSRTAGEKVPSSELKKVMYAEGDGVVTKRSFETWDINDRRGASILRPASVMLVCEDHSRLATNSEVQDRLLALFGGK